MKKIMVLLVLAAFCVTSTAWAQSGITDKQVSATAAIMGSKIAYPTFATVTDGSVPSAVTYQKATLKTLAVGDIIRKTGTALYYKCTSTTGPAWKLVGGSYSDTDGTAALPAHSFPSDPNTGMYWISADAIGFSAGGTLRLTLNSTTGLLTSTLPLVLPVGLATAPGLYFAGDTNSGLYWVGADSIGIATNAAVKFTVASALNTSASVLSVPLGTSAAPGLYFGTDANTGISAETANTLILSADGASNTLTLASGALTSTEIVVGPVGAAATPSFTFSGDENTGMSAAAAGSLVLSADEVNTLTLNATALTSTEILSVPLGALTGTSLHFGTDVNTGVYSSGANAFSLVADGASVADVTAATVTIPTGVDLAIATGGDLTIADAPTAGTDAANKDYVDAAFVYGAKLSSTAVDVGAIAVTPLYTVGAGKSCNIKGVTIRGASGTFDQATDPIINVGWDAVANGVVTSTTYTTPTATTTSIEMTIVAEKTVGAAAQVLNFNVTTAATAATTATVDVFGYCY